MNKTICVLLLIALSIPQPAFAWSEGAHHIIAVMAFRRLSKEDQAKVASLLAKNPRYAEDFTPPSDLPNDAEKDLWRIGRAGYWPDIIRKNPTYDRPTWHYEVGPTLIVGDRTKLKIAERAGPLPAEATMQTQTLHLAQALELCKKTLADKTRSDADRAVALCWVAHLVGDAHQPCHAGSLFMEKVFVEPDGDRGANRIPTVQVGNMHALWDQLLGNEFTRDGTHKRVAEITADAELIARGEKALAAPNSLDPQTWLLESRSIATERLYTPEVLDSLSLVSRGLLKKPEPINLSDAYLKNAGRTAQGRVIEAAYRLAETWRGAIQ